MNSLNLKTQVSNPEISPAGDAHVVALLSSIVPQQRHVFDALAEQVGKLTILVSTQREPNRKFSTDWGKLNVVNQSNLMLTRKWKHKGAFAEDTYIHIPWKTTRELGQLKPDVVLSYEMGFRTILSSLYCGKKVPWVLVANMSEHTEQCRGRIRPMVRKYLSRRAKIATYNGPSCKRYLQTLGFKENQLVHFPYSADPDKIYRGEKERADGPTRLFFGGALSDRKNILPFCQVLTQWCWANQDSRIEFVIAGSGVLETEIQAIELPSNLQFRFVGHLDSSQIKTAYQNADVYVYPSFADEWGLGVEEALASGVPVLASKFVQSAETLIVEDKNGWLFDPHDSESISIGLSKALGTNREKLLEMAVPARKATSAYSPKQSAKQLCVAINSAMQLKVKKRNP